MTLSSPENVIDVEPVGKQTSKVSQQHYMRIAGWLPTIIIGFYLIFVALLAAVLEVAY